MPERRCYSLLDPAGMTRVQSSEWVPTLRVRTRQNEFEISSAQVLTLTSRSVCSVYDYEFVALAKQINTQLIT